MNIRDNPLSSSSLTFQQFEEDSSANGHVNIDTLTGKGNDEQNTDNNTGGRENSKKIISGTLFQRGLQRVNGFLSPKEPTHYRLTTSWLEFVNNKISRSSRNNEDPKVSTTKENERRRSQQQVIELEAGISDVVNDDNGITSQDTNVEGSKSNHANNNNNNNNNTENVPRAKESKSKSKFFKLASKADYYINQPCNLYGFFMLSFVTLAIFVYYDLWASCANITTIDQTSNTQSTTQVTPRWISTTSTYWGGCGTNGINCRPFISDEWNTYRCASFAAVRSDYVWYVFGTDNYRADSNICKAAIQAGVITNEKGGCFRMRAAGSQPRFNGSCRNGICTQSFNSSWLSSFEFDTGEDPNVQVSFAHCTDYRWGILGYILVLFLLFVFLFNKVMNRFLIFMALTWVGYWYTALISVNKVTPSAIADRLSDFTGFVAVTYLLYYWCVKYTLPRPIPLKQSSSKGCTNSKKDDYLNNNRNKSEIPNGLYKYWLEVYVLYIIPTFIMIHMNWFEFFLPPIALSGSAAKPENSDLYDPQFQYSRAEQIIAMVVIFGAVIIAAILQLISIYYSGKLGQYMLYYAIFGIVLGILIVLTSNDFYLHMHHYILALILFPLTVLETRLSMCAQAFALGMFINGWSQWGPDSLFESSNNSIPPTPPIPTGLTLSNITNTTISIAWNGLNNETILPSSILGQTANQNASVYAVNMNTYEIYRDIFTETIIDQLFPDTTYTFCVRSVLNGYLGRCSEIINATTLP